MCAYISFQNNGHWAEEGNMLAAVHLYRHIEQLENLPKTSDEELERSLQKGYAACDNGWQLPGSRSIPQYAHEELAEIRSKYLAL